MALKNKKKFWPPQEKVEMTPLLLPHSFYTLLYFQSTLYRMVHLPHWVSVGRLVVSFGFMLSAFGEDIRHIRCHATDCVRCHVSERSIGEPVHTFRSGQLLCPVAREHVLHVLAHWPQSGRRVLTQKRIVRPANRSQVSK